MKGKILRNVTLGIGCSMLALTLLSGVVKNYNVTSGLSGNTIHVDMGSPYGMVQSKHIIHIDEDSPFAFNQETHTNMDSPSL